MDTHDDPAPADPSLHPLLRRAAAVLIDMDGTLVDSESVGPAVFGRLWPSYSDEPAPVEAFTATWRRLDGAPSFDDFLAARLGPVGRSFANEMLELYRGQVSAAPALPGAGLLLDTLDAHAIPRALVTSSTTDQATAVLDHHGWSFEVVISSDDVTATKPSPEGYQTAARRLAANGLVVVLEDAPSGLLAARRAGALAIGVTCGSFAPDRLAAEADLVVATLGHLVG